MTVLISVVAFVIVIAACVLVHEGGHFATARLLGVQVHEFAFGMGPVLAQRAHANKNGTRTLWSVRAFPVGGFCRIAGMGEDEDGELVIAGMGFNEQPAWKRFLILLNGSLFNIILALGLTALFLCCHGVLDMSSTKIGEVIAGLPAESAGLKVGDVITSVNGQPVKAWREMSDLLRLGGDVTLIITRGGESLTIKTNLPVNNEYGRPMLGVSPAYARYKFADALSNAARYTWRMSVAMLKGVISWLRRSEDIDVTGPVGIASMSGQAMRSGVWAFVSFIALISLNLGLLNLFPIPALDGGRILFVLLEFILRRRLSERVENYIHAVGFALLIGLMLFITFQDVHNIFMTR